MFGSWRVEIVVGCSVRGYPLYQLLPLAPARARGTRERQGQAQPHTEPGCPAPRARESRRHAALARPGSDTTRASGPTRPSPTTDRPPPRRAHARAGRRRREPAPGRGLRGTEHAALLGARRPRRGPPGRWAGKSRPGARKPSSGRQSPPGGVSRHRKQDNKRHHPDQNQRTSRSTEPKKPTKGLRL